MKTGFARVVVSLVVASVTACASSAPPVEDGQDQSLTHPSAGSYASDAAAPSDASSNDASADTHSDAAAPAGGTIFTILMENHDYKEVVGSSHAPYINSLIAEFGLATNYFDSGVHPSLPNYLTMLSGAPQYPGHVDLEPTSGPFPVTADNLGTQMQAAGISWRSYQESMNTACKLTASGNYAPKHDPFLYFTDMQQGADGLCADKNVDYSHFAGDLAGGTYRFMWITPNLLDDGHNPSTDPIAGLETADAWASREIPKIMASAAYQNGGVIFLTWDEAEGRGTDSKDQIPMIVVSSRIRSAGFQSSKAYSHKSYLATVEDMLGLARLPTVKTEPSMMTEFLR